MRKPFAVVIGMAAAGAVAAACATVVLSLGVTNASASVHQRDNEPGPALTTPAHALGAALSCPEGVRGDRDPVLLVPGSLGHPGLIYSANLQPALHAKGYPTCAVSLPDAAFGDIQIQAEYVVASIRKMAAKSGEPVSVIGVSVGGMVPRWAIKWWPDIRTLVGDVIGLAPDNHGFPNGDLLCGGPCPPATRQQMPSSQFLAALNRGDETPGRLSYSVIASATDGVIPWSSSKLKGERDDSNTLIQAVCPGRDVDHGHIQYDAVAIALVLDALRHDGPARASRVPSAKCAKTYPDRIDPAEVDRQLAAGDQYLAVNFGAAGFTEVEPALKKYATRPAP